MLFTKVGQLKTPCAETKGGFFLVLGILPSITLQIAVYSPPIYPPSSLIILISASPIIFSNSFL